MTPGKTGITWPTVALAALILGAFVGTFALIPEGEASSRSVLLSVISAASSGVVVWFTNRRVNEVQAQVSEVKTIVNGNTARLIAKLPDPAAVDPNTVVVLRPVTDVAQGNHD